jgi:hypothetical protein
MLDPMPAGQPALRDSFAHHRYAKISRQIVDGASPQGAAQ